MERFDFVPAYERSIDRSSNIVLIRKLCKGVWGKALVGINERVSRVSFIQPHFLPSVDKIT